ncbi:MAG: hypothetical protein K8U03_07120 [Planctomycetia bacterium]|nr:hypothetical protein [Planctomycetia bacterium]
MAAATKIAAFTLCLTASVCASPLPAVTMSPKDHVRVLRHLDQWSQAEAALTAKSRSTDKNIPRHRQDFFDALQRNRPTKVAQHGDVRGYAASMSLREAKTFKGFLFEQSLVRRWNATLGGPRYRLSSVGHTYVDIERYDPISGKTLQTLQAYGGSSSKTSLEKLLLSDRAADKLVITADVFEKIKQAIGECEAVQHQIRTGDLDLETGSRLISERARKVGLKFDRQSGELYAQDKASGRGSLGVLGTDEVGRKVGQMVRDRLTSEQVARLQFEALLDSDNNLSVLRTRLGENAFATLALQKIYEGEVDRLVQSGLRPGKAGSVATRWLQNEHAPDLIQRNARSLLRAAVYGVAESEMDRILAAMKEDVKRGVSPVQAIGRTDEKLRRLANQARRTQILKAQRILAVFTVVGAGIDSATSDQGLKEWLQSDRPVEWSARLGTGAAAIVVSGKAESLVVERLLKRGGQETAERMSARLASRIVGGGVAAAIFIVGESAISAISHDASWGEVADHAYEAALVIVVSEGAVLGADFIVSAATGGSIGGPVGIAISVGAALLYEGGKYLWVSRRELETDRLVYLAKCDVARRKLELWASSVNTAVGAEAK